MRNFDQVMPDALAPEATDAGKQPPPPKAGPGWSANLRLCFARRAGKTVLAAKRQSGPLTVQRPFYPENDVCHLYLLHPPGGVVGGDSLRLDIGVGGNAHALLTTPGAGKFYRSGGPWAEQRQAFEIGPDGILEWLPQETILFDGARVRAKTRITLHQRARFIGWEMYCLGRPMANERFANGSANLGLEVHEQGRPLLLERLRLDGEERLRAGSGMRGLPYTATFLANAADQRHLQLARILLERQPALASGATLLDGLLVARCLGENGEAVKQLLLDLWRGLRPGLLNREPCPPRIWAT